MYQILGAVAGGVLGASQASTAAKANNKAIAKNFKETTKALVLIIIMGYLGVVLVCRVSLMRPGEPCLI